MSITARKKVKIYIFEQVANLIIAITMPQDISETLIIGVSTRALFHLEEENKLFEEKGVNSYSQYQMKHEKDILKPGSAFLLIKSLLQLNEGREKKIVEVVIMSRNSPETGLRVFNSIQHYQLDISRVALTGGKSLSPYMRAFNIDLFLSRDAEDVQKIIDDGVCAAAAVYDPPTEFQNEDRQVKIAFDADAVLFSDDSEYRYKTKGMEAFQKYETEHEDQPLDAGPFAGLIHKLSRIQNLYPAGQCPIRVAIVTSRSAPAHMRVIKTLRSWGVNVDEAYFMGGFAKNEALKSFGAHIFFDDQDVHLKESAKFVPAGKVPYRSDSKMNQQKLTIQQSKNTYS